MNKRGLSFLVALILTLTLMPTVFTQQAVAAEPVVSLFHAPSLAYEDTKPFAEGISFVKKDKLWGAVDVNLKTVIPFRYEDVDAFSEGLIAVKQDGKWGYIDKTGKTIITPAYLGAGPFSDGLAPVQTAASEWAYIGKTGEVLTSGLNYSQAGMVYQGIAPVYTYIDRSKINGITDLESSVRIIDTNNNDLGMVEFSQYSDTISRLPSSGSYLSATSLWNKEGFIVVYKYISRYHGSGGTGTKGDGFRTYYFLNLKSVAAGNLSDTLGRIEGYTKSNQKFDGKKDYYGGANNFSEGYASVSLNSSSNWFFIDTNGDMRIYKSKDINGKLIGYTNAGSFVNGLAPVQISDPTADDMRDRSMWGYINKNGGTVVDFVYHDARDFGEGYAWVKSGDVWGLLYYGEPVYNYRVGSGSLKLRSGADSSASLLQTLKNGEKLMRLQVKGAWTKVQVSGGKTGWVASANIGKSPYTGEVNTKVNVLSGTLKLRADKSSSAKLLQTLKNGATLTLLDVKSSTAWVKVKTSGGAEGWVASANVGIK